MGEDVEDELADVVVDATARRYGGHDRGEVVVGQDHRRRLPGHVCSRASHRDADVGAAQGGSVVDAVAGHRDHQPLRAQGLGDSQLRLGRTAGEDQLVPLAQQAVQFLVTHPVEVGAVDDDGLTGDDPDVAGDRGGRQRVVAGDHDHADPGPAASGDGVADLGPGRVRHRQQAEQAEVALRFGAVGREGIAGEAAACESEDAIATPGVAGDRLGHRGAGLGVQGSGPIRPGDQGADRNHRLGGALGRDPTAAGGVVDRRHQLQLGVEVKLSDATLLP